MLLSTAFVKRKMEQELEIERPEMKTSADKTFVFVVRNHFV